MKCNAEKGNFIVIMETGKERGREKSTVCVHTEKVARVGRVRAS